MVFTIIFIGETGVGKSSIIRRYCENDFSYQYNPSVDIEISGRIKLCHVIKDKIEYRLPINIQIFDLPGSFDKNIIKYYLSNAHCVVFVFDIGKSSLSETEKMIREWYLIYNEYIATFSNQPCPLLYIVANKVDLFQNNKLTYNIKDIADNKENFIEKDNTLNISNILFFETSAKDGSGISSLFSSISYEVLKRFPTVIDMEKEIYMSTNSCCSIL